MAASNGPDETGKSGPDRQGRAQSATTILSAAGAISKHRLRRDGRTGSDGADGAGSGGAAGYGQALKLSSEFIAGIAVGAGLGWVIDRLAGTSPWGLIVFLLLGFGAGVLNVMRSAGMVAEAGFEKPLKRVPR